MVRRFLLVAAVVAVPGCILDRDNVHDPANVPRVRAVVIDTTLIDGRCGADFTQEWPIVAAAGRGRCLAIDARETTEPQGEEAGELEYSLVIPSNGAAVPVAVSASGAILVIQPGEMRKFPIDVQLSLLVSAKDKSGAKGVAEIALVLENTRPTAVADAPRILRLHGWPWSTPGGEPTRFDASRSSDADGDSLDYCWSFDRGDEICHDTPDHPDFERVIPYDAPGTYVGRLVVVDDIGARSVSAWAEVRVAPEALWSGNYGQNVDLQDDRRLVSATSFGSTLGSIDRGSSEMLYAVDFLDGTARVVAMPDALPVPVAGAAPERFAGLASNGTDSFWTLDRVAISTPYELTLRPHRVTTPADPGGFLTFAGTPVDSVDNGCSEAPEPMLVMDSAGNAWLASQVSQDLRVVPYSEGTPGELSVLVLGPEIQTGDVSCEDLVGTTRRNTAIAARPKSPEVWIAVAPVEPSIDDPIRLEVFDGIESDVPLFTVPLPSIVKDLAWASPDELWVNLPFAGIRLVDAPLLAAGATLDEATLRDEAVLGAAAFLADPRTGGAWASGSGQGMTRLESGGGARTLEGGSLPQLIDRDGALWFPDSGGFVRGRSAGADEIAVSTYLPIPYATETAADPSTGWLWVPVSLGPQIGFPPWSLVAVAPTGVVARNIERQDTDPGPGQVLEPFPPIGTVRVTPDGRSLYYLTGYFDGITPEEIFRLDLTTDPPTVVAHTADPAVVGPITSVYLLNTSAPDGGTPFLWFFDGNTSTVKTIDESLELASMTTVFTLPAGEQASYPSAALLAGSNRLCMVTRDNAAYRVRYLERDGTGNAIVHSEALVGASSLAFASTYVDATPGSETCFLMFLTDGIFPGNRWVARSMDAAGALIGTKFYDSSDLQYAISLVPVSRTDAWGIMQSNSGGRRLIRTTSADPPDVPGTFGGVYRSAFNSR